MAAKEKSQDERNLKTLRELAALPANKYCFDCQQRGPTYVNVTVGSFVCTSCSGMLRGLNPPHRVKSITMASFTTEEMEQIKSKGNEYCKQVWLGKYDSSQSLESEYQNLQKIKDFMIQKYEDKKYYVEPEFAVKKPKPRAPAAPTSTVPPSKNQTSVQTPSQALQKTSWASQDFPSGDGDCKDDDPFRDAGQDPFRQNTSQAAADGGAFADFGSAFGKATDASGQFGNFPAPHTSVSSTSTSTAVQSAVTTLAAPATAKPSQKKPAPPPPDRYAALADLDNQLHQQQQALMPAGAPPVTNMPPPFWPNNTGGFAPVNFEAGVPNLFGPSMSPWPQPSVIPVGNPFQNIPTHHVTNQLTKQVAMPLPSVANGVMNGNTVDQNVQQQQQNGTVGNNLWSRTTTNQPWRAAFHASDPDPFMIKNAAPADHCNPWAQSLAPESANPFANSDKVTAIPQRNATNNPFL